MTKFVKKVLLFFVLIAIIDIASGFGFNHLRSHAKGGDTQKNYYISEQCRDDILIFGSSRAARHYDPRVLEDSLGMTCYNCGEQGCGIITAYARYGMIKARWTPKMVVYEVTPNFDYFKTDDYSKYLGKIRQYANKPIVRNLYIELSDELEFIRLISNMYKNNSFIVHNLIDNLSKKGIEKGYKPLNGTLNVPSEIRKGNVASNVFDSLKYSYIEKMIVEMKKDNVPLCLVVSPVFTNQENAKEGEKEYKPVIKLCEQYNIPFINHTFMAGISDNPFLFHDLGHLNREGANLYSKAICRDLKKYLGR